MFNSLTALGYGIVSFAIVIGVGVVVLQKFATAVSSCNTGFTYNTTNGYCQNTSGSTQNADAGAQNVYYLEGQMGTSGLAGWTPAIVALSVGMLFLGVFMVRGGMGRKV